MPSVATSNITNVTRLVCGNKGTGLQIGNQPMAVFRIASGQATGDTAVLQAPNVPNILACIGPGSNNIGTAPTGVSAVTVTLVGGTATMGAVDFIILGPLPS